MSPAVPAPGGFLSKKYENLQRFSRGERGKEDPCGIEAFWRERIGKRQGAVLVKMYTARAGAKHPDPTGRTLA